ncbi:MAG TPA: OB-fold domain-containing protein [Burkholderiales bacterium]|nr:OB-fold domain-containing protein [Burkholderiales bacterium]
MTARSLCAPFAEGLRAGEIRYQACRACNAPQTLARYACRACGAADLEWRAARGTGRVYAVTTVARAPSDEYRALAPYTLAIVELDEGPRLMGHAAPGARIGDRVRAGFFWFGERQLLRFAAEE